MGLLEMIDRFINGSHPTGRDIPPMPPIAGPRPKGHTPYRAARDVRQSLRVMRAIEAQLQMDAERRRQERGRGGDEP